MSGERVRPSFTVPRPPSFAAAEIDAGLADGRFVVHYQPTVDVVTGTVVGVEALVRWHHPVQGLIGPDLFLPSVERHGRSAALGTQVLRRAMLDAASWGARRNGEPLRVWVNVTAAQLAQGERFVRTVADAVRVAGLDTRSLGLEVTESGVFDDLEAASAVLGRARRLGVELALDDFGTGHSSLSRLRALPVTWVKVDRSFVAGLDGGLADAPIVEAVVDLAAALGLRSVVEGVETAAQLEAAAALGADRVQGYYVAPPVTAAEVPALTARAWCGAPPPSGSTARAEALAGHPSSRTRLLHSALHPASDAVLVVRAPTATERTTVVYANPAFERVIGRPVDDLLGQELGEVLAIWLTPAVASALVRAVAERRPTHVTVPLRRRDGSTRTGELHASPLVETPGAPAHWLVRWRDVSQRQRTERSGEFVTFVDRLARRLADTGPATVLADLPGILAELGRLLTVDLVYLDVVEQRRVRCVARWDRRPGSVLARTGPPPSLDDAPTWAAALERGEVLIARDLGRERPPWVEEKVAVTGYSNTGEVALPLRSGGHLLGVLGFHTEHRRLRWGVEEQVFALALATVLSEVLQNQRLEAAAGAARDQAHAVLQLVGEPAVLVDASGLVQAASAGVADGRSWTGRPLVALVGGGEPTRWTAGGQCPGTDGEVVDLRQRAWRVAAVTPLGDGGALVRLTAGRSTAERETAVVAGVEEP